LAGLIVATVFTALSVGDIFASILAFVPTGWGILSVSFFCQLLFQEIMLMFSLAFFCLANIEPEALNYCKPKVFLTHMAFVCCPLQLFPLAKSTLSIQIAVNSLRTSVHSKALFGLFFTDCCGMETGCEEIGFVEDSTLSSSPL
jgi:hypothetical protein